MRTVKYI
jgi:Putative N-acetylmannosamine-6-phosphate epimerase